MAAVRSTTRPGMSFGACCRPWWGRCGLLPGHVSQNCSQVGLVDDQQVIQPFPADGADESFGERVRLGARTGARITPGADRREDAIEHGGELRVPTNGSRT